MQQLLLMDDLFPPVRSEHKRATIRKGPRDIRPGLLALKATNGSQTSLLVQVKRVRICPLSHLSAAELAAEGVSTWQELEAAMKRFYPDITPETTVTYIAFELLGELT